jgi:exosortase
MTTLRLPLGLLNEYLAMWRRSWPKALSLILLPVLLVWSYYPTIQQMVRTWWHDPHYTHGFLVVPFALYMLLSRLPAQGEPTKGHWYGFLLVVAACLVRLGANYFFSKWLDAMSLVVAIGGLVLLIYGTGVARRAWPAVAFLVFMVPLPYRLEIALGPFLQNIAARSSTYVLQTLGLCAVPDGTNIHMKEVTISVINACSGLSMLLTLITLATAVIWVFPQPRVESVIILASAPIIAVVVNIMRIVATGLCFRFVSAQAARHVLHDYAGLLMMPLGLLLLVGELYLLSRLIIREPVTQSVKPLVPSRLSAQRNLTAAHLP